MSGFELIDIARAIMGPECRVRDWATEAEENYHVAKAVHQAQRVIDLWNTRAPDPAVAALEAEVARLRAGLAMISANEYPAAGMVNGKCRHDRYSFEPCEECVWDFALSILNPAPSEKEAG